MPRTFYAFNTFSNFFMSNIYKVWIGLYCEKTYLNFFSEYRMVFEPQYKL